MKIKENTNKKKLKYLNEDPWPYEASVGKFSFFKNYVFFSYDESYEEDLSLQKDVDPFHFLKIHYNEQPLDTVIYQNAPSLTRAGNPKNHTCHICLKEYVDSKSIRRHLLRIHDILPPEGSVLYQCPECLMKFSDKSHLDRHMLKHTGIKQFACPKCNRPFGRKEHLTRHLASVRCEEKKEKASDKVKEGDEVQKKEVKMETKVTTVDVKEVQIEKQSQEEVNQEDLSQVNASQVEGNQMEQGTELLTILKVETMQTDFPQCKLCSKKFVHS